ncbi:MAG: hypothetical protein CMD58_03615 [Gammaproteobacteria bacterium]|nr:hypothetical protein [Gammaproteobacteria bacterium]
MVKNKYYLNYSYSALELFKSIDNSLCIITKNNEDSKLLSNELKLLDNNITINHFNENDILPFDHFSIPKKIIKDRFKIINGRNESKRILITSIKNIFELYAPVNVYKSLKDYELGSKVSMNELIETVTSLNYSKKNNIEKINEYSIRGGIIDIYIPLYKNPLRIEIFDDMIESIRLFDVETQLSIKNIKKFSLTSGDIICLNEETIKLFTDKWRSYFINHDERNCKIFQQIKNGKKYEGMEIYLPFFYENLETFFEIFKQYKFTSFDDDLMLEIEKYYKFIQERYEDEKNDLTRPIIKYEDSYLSSAKIKNNLNQINYIKPSRIDKYFSSSNELIKLSNKIFKNSKVVIATSNYNDLNELKDAGISEINNINNSLNKINTLFSKPIRPIYDQDKDIYIYHKENLDKLPYEVISKQTNEKINIQTYEIFKKDDYVIHEDYGLGIYSGLETLEANKTLNEYIKIIYANNENLYVPIKNINKISIYHKKNQDLSLNLDSLSSSKWTNKKIRAKKRAYDHAAEILDIESRRKKSNSYALKIDKKILQEFNNDFPYIETKDQKIAFSSIQKDLGLIKPMNRVLCGDVGFGKTEVAIRSSFICSMSDKQTIVVAPSTILCDQHYDSFLKRFEKFPVNIEKLNRFTSKSKRKNILDNFNDHKIDILITTHIVFSDYIDFHNTGLLIIDEEHKFGIKQKNFIKDKQANIHILYLSATPIPRTMNLVYAGLKDFSFLQTPPRNRLSIKSFLKVKSNNLLKEALIREKLRGGQSFILQNDIDKMQHTKDEILSLLPDLKIGIVHGQLKKNEIKQIMNDFKNCLIDCLICSTIVEMGIDIPNANTMLIENSQNFGLSQLHQLRGRIGRADKQGYCYFLIPDINIPKKARNRLDTIQRNSNLGDGFIIAREDLELRGGGEMLGEKQSGHIDNVGLSLYLSMLKEAINNKELTKEVNTEDINFYDSTYISDLYLPSPIERLKIYQQISSVQTKEELKNIKKNIIDRCGKMEQECLNLIENKKIELRLKNKGIKSIKSNDKNIKIYLTENIDKKLFNNLMKLILENNNYYTLDNNNIFTYKINETDSLRRRKNVNLLLDEIL